MFVSLIKAQVFCVTSIGVLGYSVCMLSEKTMFRINKIVICLTLCPSVVKIVLFYMDWCFYKKNNEKPIFPFNKLYVINCIVDAQ